MIELRDVRKSFGAVTAVDGLSLQVRRGEVFGLLGPNGAGKTTSVHMAVGLLAPDSGRIVVDGEGSPTDAPVRRKIGVAPQALALYEEMSGEENLAFFGALQGLSGRRLAGRVEWALRFVELWDRRAGWARTYSGGMQRRLNLAVALVHDPPILLFDEPTAGVDPQSRNSLLEKILALRGEGKTIIYTTHYMEEAQRLCDRVGIVDRGRMLALGTVRELIAAHAGRRVLTAETAAGEQRIETDDPLGELRRLEREGELRNFRVDEPNLEAVFLHLTGRSLRDE